MGNEFGQHTEWNFQGALDWYVLEYNFHSGLQKLVSDLNKLYKNSPALYEKQFEPDGFEWISYDDHKNSVMSYIRKGNNENDLLIVVCNMTPIPRENYRIGLPKKGKLVQLFNSDDKIYGGGGMSNTKTITIETKDWNLKQFSAEITVPPLGVVIFEIK